MVFCSDVRFYFLVLLTLIMNLLVMIVLRDPLTVRWETTVPIIMELHACMHIIFVLLSYKLSGSTTNSSVTIITFPHTPLWYYYVLFILGPFHLILSLWMVAEFYVRQWPHIRFYYFSSLA